MDYIPPSKQDPPDDPRFKNEMEPGAPVYGEEMYPYQENKRDFKHSGPGIASFIIALVTLIGYAVSFVFVGFHAANVLDVNNDVLVESAETIMYLGLSVLILAALNVIGAVTGIIGMTLRRRKKVFAIIGTIINGLFLLLFMLMIATVLVNAA
ncbi:hypothetical protein C2I18_21365 [Paenibacillus sp. PK3_47]|uniref:hypothetical protein n=1 Tax=Paenibacillus sp. PK3_47 TaxID=2072642 RepID=UPI00201E4507|nr:hypothetical protein [Paenibacillus sp. PK3_47]UQZ35855.1 hypothetical protein C2I18_21365 [Paenibacillus sp. PK3_47]